MSSLEFPSPPSTRASSEHDIEMIHMEEVAVTPRPEQNGHSHHVKYEHEENDEDDEDEDEGARALLGSRASHDRPRGRERLDEDDTGKWLQVKGIVIETAPTLLLTTLGLLFTGELLDHVAHWRAMKRVNELLMIIPVILNLKGNLEMNLSARLGTAANMGELDSPAARRSLILGNLTLLQVQATVVSFVAANVAFLLSFVMPAVDPPVTLPGTSNDTLAIPDPDVSTNATLFMPLFARVPRPGQRPINDGHPRSGLAEYVMVTSTSMSAACLSSLILGSFMCGLVVLCRRFGRDPDNIAPPIAACLGDLVTLCLLGLVSSIFIFVINTPFPFVVTILLMLSASACVGFTRRNDSVKHLLGQGWSPLFGAMVISSGSGIVLDLFVSRYEGFALLAVVISGLPGSTGSVFVSRLSTALHAAAASAGALPTSSKLGTRQPSPRLVMLTLLLVTFPVELVFLGTLRALGWLRPPVLFVAFSVLFFCIAVSVSLLLAQVLTNFLWSKNLDPDMYAMPIHSALVDLVGQLLLVVCFEIVSKLGADVRAPQGG
ncbi:Mg transporter [Punctularia strigosozonata HHB-11173 SS5]|uniref:Mg transporter n=1 Tax=Punctularia strigosozonata (strain HHB-11173) TaxID=741275 RepID=UPI00044162D7|nr:Mg transporter [Punctularia strigosozonata HHB-11173 SS5]EIN07878.1 Mg transporter [Punctularia strigosozonata HHB-11173 SS5]